MHLVSAPSVLEESGGKCIYIETQTPHEKLFSWDTFFFCHLYMISQMSHYLSLSPENTIGGSPIHSRDFGDTQPHTRIQIMEETVQSSCQPKARKL